MSRSTYIIICDSRINLASTKDPVEKIRRMSGSATEFVKHLELLYRENFTEADAEPITALQHWMMDSLKDLTKDEAQQACEQMILAMRALEEKFEAQPS